MKDKEGRHIPFDRRAQAAAEYLGTVFWGGGAETLPTNTESPTPNPRIVTEDLHMNLNLISMAELIWAVGKLKRRKAAGPDGLPVDCYKEMSKEQLELVLQMLNEWLEGTPTPEELTCAQIILLHKKGDKNNLENYRPIFLLNTNYKIFTTILQKRLADSLDKHLQKTQYGFRRNRGTAQALHYVRRVMEKGERTRTKTLFVLLDWEKAFDNVLHDKIYETLERMNVPPKIVNVIKNLYSKPTFEVELEGYESDWVQQKTGIRQGCPLSPYVFVILMSCLFHDIHQQDQMSMEEHRIQGTHCDQVLYADDTICMSEDEDAMERLIHAVEKEGKQYGLKLNQTKCEYLYFGNARQLKFSNGSPIPVCKNAKYLGANINNRGDPAAEVTRRIRECMATLHTLHVYFYNSDNSVTRKLQMFNAILRSKVMYGLETLAMNQSIKEKLDTFQLKCLRKILRIPTTYVNREFSNAHVRSQVNQKLKEAKKKSMITLSEYHKRTRIAYLARLITAGNEDPGTPITFHADSLKSIDHGKLRVGQPRVHWYKTTLEDIWIKTKQNIPTVKYASVFNHDAPAHVSAIKEYCAEPVKSHKTQSNVFVANT